MDWNHPTSTVISKRCGATLPEDRVSKLRWHHTNKQFYAAANSGFQAFKYETDAS